jgi:hypothetical protein
VDVRFEVNSGRDADVTLCQLMTHSGRLLHSARLREYVATFRVLMIAELWELAPIMPIPEPSASDRVAINRTVEAVIRIGVIAGLIGWCFVIARPFLLPIIWGAIIAVTVFHGYERLEVAVGGRRVLAAVLVTLSMLVLLVVPSVLLGDARERRVQTDGIF